MAQCAEIITADDFYAERHRRVFQAAQLLYGRGEPVDIVTVSAELGTTTALEEVGGMGWLAELMDCGLPGYDQRPYARIIAERSRLRQLIEAGGKIMQMGYESGESTADDVCDEAGRLLLELLVRGESAGLRPITAEMDEAFKELEQRADAGGGLVGISTGLTQLDDRTGGLQGGDLVILAARPSTGKTALATGIMAEVAIRQGKPVAFFSVEMSNRQIFYRLLASEALVNLGGMLKGQIRDDEYARLAQAAGLIQGAPLFVDDSATLNIMQLRARARRMKLERPDLALIVVDYIQKMNGPGENRTQEITGISGGLKAIAKELDVPLLALSQLSRAPDQRSDHRPQLSDLRESGSIEQDADVVMFLYRPGMYDKAEDQSETELIIGKQRNGPVGTIELHFRKESARFEDSGTWGNR